MIAIQARLKCRPPAESHRRWLRGPPPDGTLLVGLALACRCCGIANRLTHAPRVSRRLCRSWSSRPIRRIGKVLLTTEPRRRGMFSLYKHGGSLRRAQLPAPGGEMGQWLQSPGVQRRLGMLSGSTLCCSSVALARPLFGSHEHDFSNGRVPVPYDERSSTGSWFFTWLDDQSWF